MMVAKASGVPIGGWRPILSGAALAVALWASPTASAEPPAIRVVAIGASNTSGWGVGRDAAYPARLQALLRDGGRPVEVVNAGIPFETTNGMLRRIDESVPEGTRLVIIQPGANDLRFLGTPERRAANIAAMVARLRERAIAAIVYDPVFPPEHYAWDRIHVTAEGHLAIARDLLPQVIAAIDPARPGRRRGTR